MALQDSDQIHPSAAYLLLPGCSKVRGYWIRYGFQVPYGSVLRTSLRYDNSVQTGNRCWSFWEVLHFFPGRSWCLLQVLQEHLLHHSWRMLHGFHALLPARRLLRSPVRKWWKCWRSLLRHRRFLRSPGHPDHAVIWCSARAFLLRKRWSHRWSHPSWKVLSDRKTSVPVSPVRSWSHPWLSLLPDMLSLLFLKVLRLLLWSFLFPPVL